MNNPFEILRATRNPQLLIDTLMQGPGGNDPRIRKVAEMYRNHDSEGLKTMANNICQEYGTTPEQQMQKINNLIGL